MAYEELKKFFQIEEKTEKLSPLTYVLIAGISKSIAAVATYPYQVVRSRLQVIFFFFFKSSNLFYFFYF